MTETLTGSTPAQALAQHPPAVKVGGRRLSVTAKHKPTSANATGTHTTEATAASQVPAPTPGTAPIDDYPRPCARTTDGLHVDEPQEHKDKEYEKDQHHQHKDPAMENKLKKRAEEAAAGTKPTRDHMAGKNSGFGAGGRIAQPAGKFAV